MQLVIDIGEDLYTRLFDNGCKLSIPDQLNLEIAVRRGTPLPKGHGDLIDRGQIEWLKTCHDMKWGKIDFKEGGLKIKNSAPTIIEADKE